MQPSVLLKLYSDWWILRAQFQPLSIGLTSFLIEICACATQCPSPELVQTLEYELCVGIQQLSVRLHEAAGRLGSMLPGGSGGFYRAFQCILSASWLKGEGKMIEAWHAMASAVHEEQELGR